MVVMGFEGGKLICVGELLGDVVLGIFVGWVICVVLYECECIGVGCIVDVLMFNFLFVL